MPRRRLILGSLLLAALLLGGLGFAAWPRRTAITVENFKKLQPGMTLAEVEALFGGPARDELTAKQKGQCVDGGMEYGVGHVPVEPKPVRQLVWRSTDLKAILIFSADGQLGVGYGQEMIRISEPSWWEVWRGRIAGWFS